MSTPPADDPRVDVPAEPPAAPAATRRNPSTLDLLRSLVPLTLLILLAVWLYSPNEEAMVRTVDPATELAYAATVTGFDVLAAQGLSSGWRPTSVELVPSTAQGPHTMRVGYVTPADRFAEVVQSDRPREDVLDDVLGGGPTALGSIDIAGVAWDELRTADGETALVSASGSASTSTTVVTGSAGLGELTALAGALQPLAP